MRELASRVYTPPLAYAAAVLFLAHLVADLFGAHGVAFGLTLLFVPVLALLVARVEAPAWARLAGYWWSVATFLAGTAALVTSIGGSGAAAAEVLALVALAPAAAWVYGASLLDEGAGRALGAAAAAGLLFSAVLGLTRLLVLVGAWELGAILQQIALVLAIVWFAVLGKDLSAGKRHLGGPVRVVA